nr:movement protein [Potato yellowing virus]
MAFAGSSRTINDTLTRSRSVGVSSAFDFSESEWNKTMTDLDSFYEDVLIKNAPTRKCFKIDLKNNVPIEPLRLQSKENRGVVRALTDKVKGCVYVNHSIIYLVYIPSILESSTGVLTLKLFNTNTGEIIDVDTDAPANEAAIFVTRWPRSLHITEGNGLTLLSSVNVVGCKQGAIVGTLYPMWDDSFSRKKSYEKEYPSLRFPIEMTDARSAVTDVKLLKGFTMQRMIGGGTASDIAPEIVKVRSEPGKKAKTAVFKRVSTSRAGRPSSVSDDVLNSSLNTESSSSAFAEGSTVPVMSDDGSDKFKKKKFKEGYTSEDC